MPSNASSCPPPVLIKEKKNEIAEFLEIKATFSPSFTAQGEGRGLKFCTFAIERQDHLTTSHVDRTSIEDFQTRHNSSEEKHIISINQELKHTGATIDAPH